MSVEITLINHWIKSGNKAFLSDHGLTQDDFHASKNIVEFINNFIDKHKKLPLPKTVADNFNDFFVPDELEDLNYVVSCVKSFTVYFNTLASINSLGTTISPENAMGHVLELKDSLDKITSQHQEVISPYNWAKEAENRYKEYESTHQKPDALGIPTGLPSIDRVIGGILNDDTVVVMGRINQAKSFLTLSMAHSIARYMESNNINKSIHWFSTEMPEKELAFRLDSLEEHFSNWALRFGKLYEIDKYKEFTEHLKSRNINIIIHTHATNGDKPFTYRDIINVAEKESPGLVVVDLISDIQTLNPYINTDNKKRIDEVTIKLRDYTLNSKIPFILVAQANREAAKSMKKDPSAVPEMAELEGSDKPCQKATKVISMAMTEDGSLKTVIKKNRNGQKNMEIWLSPDFDRALFKELNFMEERA